MLPGLLVVFCLRYDYHSHRTIFDVKRGYFMPTYIGCASAPAARISQFLRAPLVAVTQAAPHPGVLLSGGPLRASRWGGVGPAAPIAISTQRCPCVVRSTVCVRAWRHRIACLCSYCIGLGLANLAVRFPPHACLVDCGTSAPGLTRLPPCHICTGTRLTPWLSHLHRDGLMVPPTICVGTGLRWLGLAHPGPNAVTDVVDGACFCG